MADFEFITQTDIEQAEKEVGVPNYGALGSIVDSRTYLRWLPDKKRRETFFERNARVVNYNVGLAVGSQDIVSLQEEADKLFKQLNYLKVWGSGRVAWVAGTKASQLVPESTMNCSASIVDRIEAFPEAFHLLCLGCGYGFRIYPEDLEKIPELVNKGRFVVSSKDYKPIVKGLRLESTTIKSVQNSLEVIIGDSRESWCSAIAILLQLYTGIAKTAFFDFGENFCFSDITTVQFNFDNIRPEGERIAGFGGIASGPKPLEKLLLEFARIIEEEAENNKLSPLNAMDMMCIMGDVVRSGNVRRSSLITLFHYLDEAVKNAKRGLWTDPKMAHKRYRSMANNSILYDDNYKPSLEEFKELMQVIRYEGEPGFIRADKHKEKRHEAALMWRKGEDPSWYTEQAGITNPCFAPGTLILTKQGHFKIEDLVGKEVEVYDGEDWVTIDNFRVTGENQEVYNVLLHNGQSVVATSEHTFYLEDGTKKLLKELEPGDRLLSHSIQFHGNIDKSEPGAYLKGFLLGDGTSSENKPILLLYEPKYNCKERLINSCKEVNLTEEINTNAIVEPGFLDTTYNRALMQGITVRRGELIDWVTTYREEGLPPEVLNWDFNSKLELIAGYLDADGTASDTKNGFMYQVTSVNYEQLKSFQLLLQSIGIKSSLKARKDSSRASGKYDFKDKGGICNVKPEFRITISQSASIKLSKLVKFTRLTSFAEKTTKYNLKDKSYVVSSIEFAGVSGKVYCCTVPTNHRVALSNGVITGQCGEINLSGGYKKLKAGSYCNLVSIPVPDYISEDGEVLWDELEEALRVVTRFAVRQTLIDISLPLWDETQKKERLLGVDLCGTWEAFDKMGVSVTSDESNQLRAFCRQIANDEATKYSQGLGIERPLLVTTGKPNGTYAQLRTIASGCHPPYAPFYIRRIRIAATDALAKTLIEQKIPYYPETSEWESYFRTNLSHLIKKDAEGNEMTTVWDMLKIYDDFGKPVLPEIKTLVFEFPVKTAATRKTSEISAIEQLENYKMQMIHYIDHNQSVTITVGDNEWDEVAEWFEENWDYVIGVSLLPKFADDVYPLLPYQECTEEEFNQRVAAFPEYPLNVNMDLLNKFELEIEETQDIDDVDTSMMGECSAGGSCPVR